MTTSRARLAGHLLLRTLRAGPRRGAQLWCAVGVDIVVAGCRRRLVQGLTAGAVKT
ncbi:hypothetical protein [Sorangium sp. So ce1099]|uniref:hypothetical protein n=1 Tax=Sorangium sp. So ce1099 TaxID=3133331 RepID=UPI003F602309